MVQKAVSAYVEKAVACVKEDSELKADPSFADRVIKVEQSVSRTFVNSDEDKTFASNNRPSLATTIVVGVLAGFVAAMVIVLIRYAVDKRVKSVRDLLPSDKSETVVVGEDYADAYVSLAAKLNASGVKSRSSPRWRTTILPANSQAVLPSIAAVRGSTSSSFCSAKAKPTGTSISLRARKVPTIKPRFTFTTARTTA